MGSKILAGRYELFEKIGEGGMSVVYKARCKLLNRYVAIKILKPEFIKDQKFIESFRRESQAAASLSHPNIVNIYDVGKEGNIHYIVMELVEGRTLSELIREEGPLSYQQAIEIAKQIAAALSLAHKNNIIHRDVKPHNVLITDTGVAKITDFGIAKAINSSTIVENTGSVIGSVHYFSPEQARGGYVDEKSDLYSLGIVMYEMITGRVPFDGENAVSIALMHINSEMVAPSKLVAGIPPKLEQIVLKCTDKYQSNRFESADDLIAALENLEFLGSVVGNSVFMGDKNQNGSLDKPVVQTDFDNGDDEYYEEPKQKPEKAPKGNGNKKKKIIIAAIIAAILLICAGVGIAASKGAFSEKPIIVPDLTGVDFQRAQELAGDLGFQVEQGEEVFDEEAEKGEIVSQNPEPKSEAKKGTIITVNISKGPEDKSVPNVIGKALADAEAAIREAGFKVGSVTPKAGEETQNTVIDQSPEGGESAPKDTTIDITYSDGTLSKVKMPSLLGKSLEDAQDAISDAGLSQGKLDYEESDQYDKNTVMWQQYGAGTNLQKDTSVALKISKGKPEPKSVILHIDFDRAKEEVFYMTVTLSDESGTRNVINNQQRVKDEDGEDVELNGKGKGTVTVIFDGKQVLKQKVDFSTGSLG